MAERGHLDSTPGRDRRPRDRRRLRMGDTSAIPPLERFIGFVLHRRWAVLVATTLLMLAVTGGARFIGITNDYRSLFDEDNPQLAALDALEETYASSNTALVAVAPRRGVGLHPRDARRDRGADRGGVAGPVGDPGRLPDQLLPQRGVRGRPRRRAAGRGRAVSRRRRSGANRRDRPRLHRARRAAGLPRRRRGRARDQLRPARGHRCRARRDLRLSPRSRWTKPARATRTSPTT